MGYTLSMTNQIDKLKKIKKSQEQIARDIGVSVRTVQRWFKGISEPSKMAQSTIDSYLSNR